MLMRSDRKLQVSQLQQRDRAAG